MFLKAYSTHCQCSLTTNSNGTHTNKYGFTTVGLAVLITNPFAGDSHSGKCKRCGRDAECDKICV